MVLINQTDPFYIIEEEFQSEKIENSAMVFSLGNGHIRQNGNFEEYYSGNLDLKTNVDSVYADNRSENLEKGFLLSNLPDWTSFYMRLNDELVDLKKCNIISFSRILNMKQGFLERNFEIITPNNHHIDVSVQRFLSLAQPEIAAIKYLVRSKNFVGKISFNPVINGDFNMDEPEWNVLQTKTQNEVAHLWIQTRKTNFQICEAMTFDFIKNNVPVKVNPTKIEKQKVSGYSFGVDLRENDWVCVYKYVSILSSLNHFYQELTTKACDLALEAKSKGWNTLFQENCSAWEQSWKDENLDLADDFVTNQSQILNVFQKFQPEN